MIVTEFILYTNDDSFAEKDHNSKSKEEAAPIVVSVDRAGSVKVRIRKKSKRRKKKSNLGEICVFLFMFISDFQRHSNTVLYYAIYL